ncbi:MAG: hypothetical protein PVH41_17375 [Anaerolineae bacterium]|jgi:arginyl-tRNA synthetase
MLEEQPEVEQSSAEGWSEVGRQFEALGASLARALRAAWAKEETRQHVQAVREGMEKMVGEVDRAVEDAAQSPHGQKLREHAAKTAESLRSAGEQTWQEAQPHLLSALTKINAELKAVIDRLELESASREASPDDVSIGTPDQTASDA